jgi:hypothetical protein
MLKLLMEQNAQLKEMEAEMERLLKEKEQMKPMEVIPLSAIPISGLSTTTVTAIPICNTSVTTRRNNRPCQVHGEDEPARDRNQQA